MHFFFYTKSIKIDFIDGEKCEAAYLLLFPLDFNDDVTLCLYSLSILDIFSQAFGFVV